MCSRVCEGGVCREGYDKSSDHDLASLTSRDSDDVMRHRKRLLSWTFCTTVMTLAQSCLHRALISDHPKHAMWWIQHLHDGE